jgi:hypothetical protein
MEASFIDRIKEKYGQKPDLLQLFRFDCQSKEELNVKMKAQIGDYDSGVYIVYNFHDENDILYVGLSGSVKTEGNLDPRSDGIRGRILKGGKGQRVQKWLENTSHLGLLLIVLKSPAESHFMYAPAYLEASIIQKHLKKYKRLPKLNNAFGSNATTKKQDQ